jgi:phosphate transport system protein
MVDQRTHFHAELEALEQSIHGIGDRAHDMVGKAVQALITGDSELARQVQSADRFIDQMYLDIHNRWINLIARQQPMGADLRLMSVLLHMNVTLERTGDQAVNVAKLAELCLGLPSSDRVNQQIQEMGDLVRPMLRTAIESFIRRDADEARLLLAMDEPVDRLNMGMYREVVALGTEPRLLEWATHMMMAARALERIGDQSVDIGEQVVYLVTGELHDFNEEALDERGSGP